jgi:hypothetical protein
MFCGFLNLFKIEARLRLWLGFEPIILAHHSVAIDKRAPCASPRCLGSMRVNHEPVLTVIAELPSHLTHQLLITE